jgi:hypothetical protein
MHKLALALQTIPHGNVFVDLALSHKKLLPSFFIGPRVRIETFAQFKACIN